MGCSTSLVNLAVAHSKQTNMTKQGVITNREIGIIKLSWRRVCNDMPKIGAKIFVQIFTLQPEIKQIFPFRDVTGERLKNDHHFRGHASRFMQAVGAAVDNINDLETAMAPLLYGIGKEHINYKGFDVEYFDVFPVAILHVLRQELGTKFGDEDANAWRHMLDFMISNLKEGYYAALRNKPPR